MGQKSYKCNAFRYKKISYLFLPMIFNRNSLYSIITKYEKFSLTYVYNICVCLDVKLRFIQVTNNIIKYDDVFIL